MRVIPGDEEPFCSHIFLNTHSGEGVFGSLAENSQGWSNVNNRAMCISKLFVARGLEYAEQLHLSPQDLSLPDHSFEYVDFLHVYRHWKLGQVRESKANQT